ncbi:Ig-like domain-containing protein [Pontibacter ruber]|uniref:Ig-like domain-containing protein n=1 Tax=Pontibacter ruber TaxID=1343895 RepID=A0ABW5CZT3_9BACT
MVLLFIFLTSFSAVASHFKGGQVTYKYLGGGQYEMTIRGYWDKDAVGSISLSYEGSPKYNTGSTSISKTLLPDGITIEHVQRQRITWSKPGLYQISWKSCCRANGSNFGSEESGLFAAVNYNPDAPSSSPQFYDLPIFNFNVDKAISFNMNMEDPEGHEQDYSLEIPFGVSGDPYKLMRESGFSIANDGTIKWERPLKGLWLVNVKLREKINGQYTGAFVLRDFILNISSGNNTAPEFTQLTEQFVQEGQSLSFEVAAQDAEKQNVTLNANSSLLEKGASFSQTAFGDAAKGTFTWTPQAGVTGKYTVQFVATDSDVVPLSTQMTVYINVVPKGCAVQAAYTLDKKTCAGSSTGKVTLKANNGVAPFSYSLNGGSTFQSSATFDNLAAGTYSALVKDATGCVSATVQVRVEEEALPVVSFNMPSSVACVNASPLTLTGGYPAGGSYTGTGVENGVFNPAVAGIGKHTITYTYTNANGCTNATSQVMEVSVAPVVNAGADQNVIYGYEEKYACATLTASGDATYTYNWSTGSTTQSIKVCPTTTTTYTVTVTDKYGCTSTDEVTVFVNDVRCGNNSRKDKVVVCHKGKPICIAPQAVQAHLDHGDVLGDCSTGNAGTINTVADYNTEIVNASISPNPIQDKSQLKLIAHDNDQIAIDIVDLNGRVVKQLYKGEVIAGKEYSFDISRSIGSKQLYIGRIKTSKGVQIIKLMIAE